MSKQTIDIRSRLPKGHRLTRDYHQRKRIPDEFNLHLESQGLQQIVPFAFPSPRQYEELEQGGNFRVGSVGRLGQGLNICLHTALLLGVSIVGGSGMGKSTFLARIIHHIAQHLSCGSWVLNIREEPTSLVPGYTNVKATDILPALFQIKPYLSPEVQAGRLADLIGSIFYLLWSKAPIAKVLAQFYRQNQSPTIWEVREAIASLKPGKQSGINASQHTKLVGVFDYICHYLVKVQNDRSGFEPEKHQGDRLVILMDTGSTDISSLLAGYFWMSAYDYNVAHGHIDDLKLAIVIDESRGIFNTDREKASAEFGSPFFSDLVCTQRRGSVCTIPATQTFHPSYVQSNINGLKIQLNVGSGTHFDKTANDLGLSYEQAAWGKHELTRAQAIVSTYNHKRPLLCALNKPKFEPTSKEKRESQTREYLEKINGHHTQANETRVQEVESRLLFNMEKKSEDKKTNKRASEEPRQQTLLKVSIVSGANELLKTIAEHEILSTAQAYKKSALTASLGNKAKRHLEENKLITSKTIRYFSGRGRNPCFIEQTKMGEEYIKHYHPNIKVKNLPGRGGLTHRIHQQLVAKKMKDRGWIVKVEGKEADLALQKPGDVSWVAVEIINKHSRNVQRRIKENKNAGAKHTLVISTDKESKRRYNNLVIQNVVVEDIEKYLAKRGTEKN